ncbi:MAG: MBOAT family protein [Deltaproteobacteria bacterium]|nr:MBOAT family protein [Deltaproteobacteria bacterium]
MLFNSVQFLVFFFPIVTTLYFVLPQQSRWAMLLVASSYFYMAFVPKYILILVFLIAVDYAAGLLIEGAQGRRRSLYLYLSLVANVATLAVFKYYNFVNENLETLFHGLGLGYHVKNLSWLLPIGLSFHTFQSMSYTIEVYRGKQKAERHLGIYALYVMYYPQLVAGPIERPQNLLHQFHEKKSFDYARVVDGLQLMLWGLFKKCFVADRLGIFVDEIYNNPHAHDGWSFPYVAATYLFAYQIYCDFSGYSDIARGASRVMGIELMENFRYPFSAKSISEFWQRWHISLSTWFKDYLYMPLAYGSITDGVVKPWKLQWYVVVVFLVSGFWHGAGWNYGIWGALHGLFIVCSTVFRRLNARINGTLKTVITFHLVGFTWVLFRANSMADALAIYANIFGGKLDAARSWHELVHNEQLHVGVFVIAVLLVLERIYKSEKLKGSNPLLQKLQFNYAQLYYAALLVLLFMGAPLEERAFIYFQF